MKKAKKARIWEVDFFRGFAIIMVIWDHAMVALTLFHSTWIALGEEWLAEWGQFGFDYLYSDLRLFWRPVFVFIFFFASGISTAFSKNNLIRGLRLAGVSLMVTLFTYLFSYLTGGYYQILFGVLHCIAVIILIYTLFSYLVDGTNRLISGLMNKAYSALTSKMVLSILCLFLAGVFYWIHLEFNISLYETDVQNMYLRTDSKWLGLFFYVENWATADYFPLFPFISFFFFGAGLAHFLYPKRKSLMPSLDWGWHKPFSLAGRYSLIIYLSIQIVVFAVFALITFIATGEFLL